MMKFLIKKNDHILLVPIPNQTTTIVDLGSGIFGERTPEDAEKLVSKRLTDLVELKSQFEADAATLTQRIEELASSFEKAAKQISEAQQTSKEVEEDTEENTTSISKRRRRKMGGELTLDD